MSTSPPFPPASASEPLPFDRTREVGAACLCLFTQRAARALARHFDQAMRPLGLTNGQFSLLMRLNVPDAPVMGEVAEFLEMDRTSLTAMLKPLRRQGLVKVIPDPDDRRKNRLHITGAGRELLGQAYPVWRQAHAALEAMLADPDALRAELLAVSRGASSR